MFSHIVLFSRFSRITPENEHFWRPGNRDNQFIKADLGTLRIVYAIRTRRGLTENYVKQFTISTSLDGSTQWETIQSNDGGGDLVFEGNTSDDSVVTNPFPEPLITRFVRLNVVAYGEWPALRWAIDGCPII